MGTCHVVVDGYGTTNPKFYLDLLLFHLAQGFTRPQKTPKIPKKGLKSAHTNFIWHFKEFIWNKICSLFYFKAKNEEKQKKIFFLLFFRSKPFFFQKKILIFKVPVIFWKCKFCRVCTDFLELNSSKYSQLIAMCPFSKIA